MGTGLCPGKDVVGLTERLFNMCHGHLSTLLANMEILVRDMFRFVSSTFGATLGLRMIRLRGKVIIVKTKLLRYESSSAKYIYVYAKMAGNPNKVFWHRI